MNNLCLVELGVRAHGPDGEIGGVESAEPDPPGALVVPRDEDRSEGRSVTDPDDAWVGGAFGPSRSHSQMSRSFMEPESWKGCGEEVSQ